MSPTTPAFLLKHLRRLVLDPFAFLPADASPFAFPICSGQKEQLLERLTQQGINAPTFWAVPHSCLPAVDFPWAELLRNSIIALQVHQELGSWELKQIVTAVLSSVEAT